MAIRTILVPVDGTDAAKPALDAAFAVARDLAAHVDVLHVRVEAKDAVPLLGEGMSGAMIEEMIELAEKESRDRAAMAKTMFDTACSEYEASVVESPPPPGGGVSAAWIEEKGREDEVTAWRGRLADLVAVSRPTPEAEVSAAMTLNAALFETGRPVLMAPPASPARFGRKVAISWNGSAEAARAVAFALPLITRSEKTVILSAETDQTVTAMAPKLASYLSWHGVTAEVHTVSPSGHHVGETLLEACASIGIDLLVMGAYTHSRVRQLILGGVTRHVLSEASLPVFMAH